MKVLSYQTNNSWIESRQKQDAGSEQDKALDEIRRVLFDCFRCSNLVILTGLGTSLHVNLDTAATKTAGRRVAENGKRIAPTMWELWEKTRAANQTDFDKVQVITNFPKEGYGNIEALLSYCKMADAFLVDSKQKSIVSNFVSSSEAIIRDEVRFLSSRDELNVHSELLRKIARRSNRKVRCKVFTTNYDLCIEHAANRGRYVIIDGFSHTSPQVFDSIYFTYDIVKRESTPDTHDFIQNVFHLYKLHGSIDWTKNVYSNEIEKDAETEKPILIYPRNAKYELAFEQPYIEMMAALQASLRQPDTGLLVVGFGFNDNHIAEPILSAIHSNLSLSVVVCDPALSPKDPIQDGQVPSPGTAGTAVTNRHLSKIRYLITQGDARLSLINGTFEELVMHLPDIAAQTDLEQHLERMRLLRIQENG